MNKWKQMHYTIYLHTTDQLGISSIAKCTAEDPVLCKILGIIKSGKTYRVPISNSRFVIHNLFSTFHKSPLFKKTKNIVNKEKTNFKRKNWFLFVED